MQQQSPPRPFPPATGADSLSTLPSTEHDAADGARPNPALAGASQSAPRIRRRNRMIASCLECRRRKLKCSKSHPCTNCTKHTRTCVFLAPSLDSASQLKLTEIKEKIGSLERVIEQDVARSGAWRRVSHDEAVDFAPVPEDERNLEPTSLAVADAIYDDDADGELTDLGFQMGKMRLNDRIGGFFRPKIVDEIGIALADDRDDQRNPYEGAASAEHPTLEYGRPANFMAPGPTFIAPSSGFFFSHDSYGNSLIDFLPSRQTADHLLNQYWVAVDPIAKAVHRPSFEGRYEAFWDEIGSGVEPMGSLQALVFAVVFSGAVSMPEESVSRDFGKSKQELVRSFQRATEMGLTRANFLQTTKVETMQAFIIYMIPLCRAEMSRAHSALVGTGIRLAECMGLHRDGSVYGLGPVETHVRRLLWYQLSFLDIRACEAQGPRPGIREDEFDTNLPLNVDDIDIQSSRPLVRDAERWTDMTFTLMRTECNEMYRRIWIDRARLEKKEITVTVLLGKIENFKRIMYEKYHPMMDESIPLQKGARLVLRILVARMHIMVLHRYHKDAAIRIPDRLRQITLTSGTELLECAVLLETDPTLAPWAWYSGTYQQYQTAFLMLFEIFAFPMRREADRIWRVLDYVFEPPIDLSRDKKARMIMKELRNRMGIYRDIRKLRVPLGMLKWFDDLAGEIRKRRCDAQMLNGGEQGAEAKNSFTLEEKREAHNHLDLPDLADIPSQSSDTSLDMLPDIDWAEWDKLFPPGVNTGDLGIPMSPATLPYYQ